MGVEIEHLNSLNKIKYVFVVNTLGPFGGAERQALILAEYIKCNVSKNVLFLAFEDGKDFKLKLEKSGIRSIVFPFKHNDHKLNKVYSYFQLIRFLKPHKPDVFIPYVAESNKIIAQIWRYTGAKFAFWNQREEGRKLYGTNIENKLIRGVSQIVSNSVEGKKALMRLYNLQDHQITIINNGIIPYDNFIEEINWHDRFYIDSNRPIIPMIANITERKDHETLIKAWALVVNSCKLQNQPIPYLALVGRKVRTYDALRLLAFDLNLSNHIGFTGALENVQSIIKPSLFCVFSSNLEGCPNGVLECMEQGKAVVATHIDGIEQALGTKFAQSVLVEPNNPKEFSKKILNILSNSELRVQIEQHNKNRIANDFSVEKMAKQHLDFISKSIKA